MKILVTGAAGFIGFHTSKKLIDSGYDVVGLDNINDYYDVNLKKNRLKILQDYERFTLYKINLEDQSAVENLFAKESPQRVIHLAAQAGVRNSIHNPEIYIQSNIIGTFHILEVCRHNQVEHLVYASTSSAYGLNTNYPFSTHNSASHPASLYGATKLANELMAHSYSHLYTLPTTGLRFFTVYGPWGRPDMALFKFTKAILSGKEIEVFNYGKHRRDFTYIDDIIEGVIRVLDKPANPNILWNGDFPDPGSSKSPWRVYNIGNNSPVELLDYIAAIEKALNLEAKKNLMPLQPGDVPDTYANVEDLVKDFNYKPSMSVETGVRNFVEWYKKHYEV